jgi:hypothetical protein
MPDRVFATAGDWALASDGVQWMLMRRQPNSYSGWKPVSFVRSTRDVLARCMREKGVGAHQIAQLLAGLPDTFDQWKSLWGVSAVAAGEHSDA